MREPREAAVHLSKKVRINEALAVDAGNQAFCDIGRAIKDLAMPVEEHRV